MKDKKFRLSARIRHRAVEDEGVLVHLENGRVMVVNEVGLYIVKALGQEAMTMTRLAESVAAAFEVDASQARTDVALFLEQLRGEKAIDLVDDVSLVSGG